MADCIPGDDLICINCGARLYSRETHRDCGSPPPKVALPKVAVGGLVEKMLTSIGITKQRVQELTRTRDCGCEARQRWLDQWGYQQQEKLERLLNRAAKFYFGGALDAPATVAGERDADAAGRPPSHD